MKQMSCRLDAVQLNPFMSSSLLSGVFCFNLALLFSISMANYVLRHLIFLTHLPDSI